MHIAAVYCRFLTRVAALDTCKSEHNNTLGTEHSDIRLLLSKYEAGEVTVHAQGARRMQTS